MVSHVVLMKPRPDLSAVDRRAFIEAFGARRSVTFRRFVTCASATA